MQCEGVAEQAIPDRSTGKTTIPRIVVKHCREGGVGPENDWLVRAEVGDCFGAWAENQIAGGRQQTFRSTSIRAQERGIPRPEKALPEKKREQIGLNFAEEDPRSAQGPDVKKLDRPLVAQGAGHVGVNTRPRVNVGGIIGGKISNPQRVDRVLQARTGEETFGARSNAFRLCQARGVVVRVQNAMVNEVISEKLPCNLTMI